jgi:hypothetical protein
LLRRKQDPSGAILQAWWFEGGGVYSELTQVDADVCCQPVTQILGGEIVQRCACHEASSDSGNVVSLIMNGLHELRQPAGLAPGRDGGYPLKPAQAQASRATFPTHWGRKVSRLWCIARLVEIDAAAAGCPQDRMDSPAAWSSLAALQTA